MNQLNGTGRSQCFVAGLPDGPGRGQAKCRTNTLATTQHTVTHGLLQSIGSGAALDTPVQFCVDTNTAIFQKVGHLRALIAHSSVTSEAKGRVVKVPSSF